MTKIERGHFLKLFSSQSNCEKFKGILTNIDKGLVLCFKEVPPHPARKLCDHINMFRFSNVIRFFRISCFESYKIILHAKIFTKSPNIIKKFAVTPTYKPR